jgi:hypothetical protein
LARRSGPESDFHKAEAAYDALEKENGPLDFQRERLVADVETLTAEFLTRHMDGALAAWKASGQSRRVNFDAFLEFVLPYRGSEEPAEDWRTPLLARYHDFAAKLGADPDAKSVHDALGKDVWARIRFDERYYLHPTDEAFSEMERTGMGRCEDMTNDFSFAA